MSTKKRKKLEVNSQNFAQLLLESTKQAHSHAQGKITLKSTEYVLPDEPPKFSKSDIKKLRNSLKVSQPVFAKILACSTDTVKAWEFGTNKPGRSVRRLLQLLRNDPEDFLKKLKSAH